MIKENQFVEVKVEKRTLQHYLNFGAKFKGDVIKIEAKNLYKSSKERVFVECDICHIEKIILFSSYYKSIEKGGYYCCSKCRTVKITETNMKKYGQKYFTNPEKSKKTNLEKYGCENVSQLKEIKEKKKKTNLKNWGVENVFQSDVIKQKLQQTCLEKFGVKHPLQNQELLDKSKQTCLKNNGVEYPTMSDEILIKRNENNLKKFGKEHYSQTKKYKIEVKKTNMKKYGSKWYMSSKDFKNKSKITNMKKYGVEYNMQNENIYMKAQINGFKAKIHKNTCLFYRGDNEKNFLDYCFDKKIKIEKGKKFSYSFNGKNRVYFSDYFLQDKNLVIEIKSNYYYKKYYEMNIAKMNAAIKDGYNFIFIIDKNYNDFEKLYIDL